MPRRIGYLKPPHAPTPTEQRRNYDQARQEDKNFYSSDRWRRLRAAKLRDQPLCEDCRASSRLTKAEHVHHIQPRKLRPDLACERLNLRSLCAACHNALDVR
jgi:5-methylcytosine-specific restriction protein A